jgi:steroid delta-isomerase
VPTTEEVQVLIDEYCEAMSANDRERWLDCFTDDAVQEDPVGTPPNIGRAAIGAFFDANVNGVTLRCTAPPLVVGNEVIAFFAVRTTMGDQTFILPRIIDHIVLDDTGTRFASLRAFFDFSELVPAVGDD